jgi:hypothetical protein
VEKIKAQMRTIMLSALLVFLSAVIVWPQGTVNRRHILNLNYIQLREEMNYGLVFRGPGIGYTYHTGLPHGRNLLEYEAMFGLTYMQTRKVPAATLHIVPVKLGYLYSGSDEKGLAAGPFILADYSYYFYPDLQSGHSFWLTHFSVGGMLRYGLNINRQLFSISLNTILFGFTSRQPGYHDPYFWDLSAGDIVKYFHRDLTFGTWGDYHSSELEVRWQPSGNARFQVAYEMEVTRYFRAPELSVVNQSLKIIVKPKIK